MNEPNQFSEIKSCTDGSLSNNSTNLRKKLNIKAKVFTRSSWKEDNSLISSICSEISSPSANLEKISRVSKELDSKNIKLAHSEKEYWSELENKEIIWNNDFMKEEIDLRFSSKSMQNTQWTTSPIKNSKKIKSFSIKSKDFKPNNIKYAEENIQKDFEEEQFDPHFIEPAVGSFIEMSMYQLLNERLTTYANTNINNPFDVRDLLIVYLNISI